MNDAPPPLSIAIITKNEERNILECLKSVLFAADIVVVDSGSEDRTVDIAKENGCRTFVEEWKGYGPQKNSAIEKCLNEWVLMIDADERTPEETAEEIAKLVGGAAAADAYSFPRKNFFHGKWIRRSGWWPDETVRLVRKSRGRVQGMTHERWVTDGRVEKLSACLEHYSFRTYADMFRVMNDRSTHMARELFEEGARTNAAAPFLHGAVMFVKTYFLKLGFMDGLDGFIIAAGKAGGTFLKYAKLLELQRTRPAG